jgi:hypothetical protein
LRNDAEARPAGCRAPKRGESNDGGTQSSVRRSSPGWWGEAMTTPEPPPTPEPARKGSRSSRLERFIDSLNWAQRLLLAVGGLIFAAGTVTAALVGLRHGPGPKDTPSPSPSASPVTSSPSSRVTSSPLVPTPSPTTPGPSPSPQVGNSNGDQLGTYSFNLPVGYFAPLGVAKPDQAQISSQSSGDIVVTQAFGTVEVVAPDRLFPLQNGATPTYAACKALTVPASGVGDSPGTTFCVAEIGEMVGVTVTSTSSTPPPFVALQVTVWHDHS